MSRVSRVLMLALPLALLLSPATTRLQAQAPPTAILDRAAINPRRAIDFHAMVLPDSVFVGQQATYQVAVLLSADARSRLRRNPEFLPPELRGLLAYELGTPTRVAPRTYGGAVFEAHVFQRALFPVTDGPQMVPAPQLTYSLPQSSSYFSREERFVVRAESASFVVKPLPLAGRPEDFNGAVGVFTASVRIDTGSARVGDPVILTLRVQGTGNVKLLPRPTIELDWASVVAGTERIQVDSSGSLVRGTKEFDWILTPARSGRVTVPALRYSYFNPYTGQYAVAASTPKDLPVARGSLAAVEEGEPTDLLPLRVVNPPVQVVNWSGHGLPPASWWPWLLLVLLSPLPTLWWSRRPRDAAAVMEVVPGNVEAAAAGAAVRDARDRIRATRREFLTALADRFGHSPQSLVSRTMLARVLRRAGVTRGTTRDVLALLERLDEIGFADVAHGATNEADVARETRALMARVEQEALPRGRQIPVAALAALMVLTLASVPATMRADMLPDRFPDVRPASHRISVHTTGVSAGLQSTSRPQPVDATFTDVGNGDDDAAARAAYERRAFGEAEQRFALLARARMDDVGTLVNWGTAAWAAHDTVAAVVAWQRAARLAPLATDIQQRIDLLPAGARGGVADVPMIPVLLLLRLAVGLWLSGWALWACVAFLTRPGRVNATRDSGVWASRARALAIALVVLGAGSGVTAWYGMRALDATALAVVSRPETLRIAPGMDADAMGGVTTGDVVRVVEHREPWLRVVHADGRRGWLPNGRVTQIVAGDSARTNP